MAENEEETEQLEATELLPSPPADFSGEARVPTLLFLSGQRAGCLLRLQAGTTVLGRSSECDVVLLDPGISRQHAQLTCLPDGTVTFADLGSTNGSYLGGESVLSAALRPRDILRLGPQVAFKFDYFEPLEEQLQSELYEQATRDGLTGCYNKRHFLGQLRQSHSHAQRHRLPLSLAIVDADHFKRINDTHGHAAGDEVLKELARRLTHELRSDDFLARFGGEEFACLMQRTDRNGASRLCERLGQAMRDEPFVVPTPSGEVRLAVTVSIGVAELDPGATADTLFLQADSALYAAKNAGRDRVMVFRQGASH